MRDPLGPRPITGVGQTQRSDHHLLDQAIKPHAGQPLEPDAGRDVPDARVQLPHTGSRLHGHRQQLRAPFVLSQITPPHVTGGRQPRGVREQMPPGHRALRCLRILAEHTAYGIVEVYAVSCQGAQGHDRREDLRDRGDVEDRVGRHRRAQLAVELVLWIGPVDGVADHHRWQHTAAYCDLRHGSGKRRMRSRGQGTPQE